MKSWQPSIMLSTCPILGHHPIPVQLCPHWHRIQAWCRPEASRRGPRHRPILHSTLQPLGRRRAGGRYSDPESAERKAPEITRQSGCSSATTCTRPSPAPRLAAAAETARARARLTSRRSCSCSAAVDIVRDRAACRSATRTTGWDSWRLNFSDSGLPSCLRAPGYQHSRASRHPRLPQTRGLSAFPLRCKCCYGGAVALIGGKAVLGRAALVSLEATPES